jgi:hypothetical protein
MDTNRIKNLGMGGLLQKIGINLQEKVSKEVSKYDQPIKLKKMSD